MLSHIVQPLLWLNIEFIVITISCVIFFISDLKRKAWFIWHFDAIGNLIQYSFIFIMSFIIMLLLRWKLNKIDNGTPYSQISWVSIEIILVFLLVCFFIKKLFWRGKNRAIVTIILVIIKLQVILTAWKVSNVNKIGSLQWTTIAFPLYVIFILLCAYTVIELATIEAHYNGSMLEYILVRGFGILRAAGAIICIFLMKFIANYLDGLDEKGTYFKALYWIALVPCLVGLIPIFGNLVFDIVFNHLEVEMKLHNDLVDKDYSTAFLTDSEDLNDLSDHQ